jgi:signal transduction histidine kinase
VAPIVSFTAVNIEGEKDTAALYSANKKLPYHNSIGFVFTANSFIDEKKVLYKYQLEGFDKTWSKPTAHNSINYTSLSPGEYKFKVLACNANGLWSVTAAVFAFEIDQPFYKEWWFIVGCLLIPLVVFFSVRLFQLQKKIALEKLRLHIARDLHDDIGSTLGSVNILTQTAQRRLMATSSGEGNYEILSKISTMVQGTLDSMDDIIWTINPEKEKYEDLVLRMREFAIPACESKNVEFKLQADLPETQTMSLDLKKNSFLIFKEAVNNSLKHSNCKSLVVEAAMNHNAFHVKIVDDGNGFDCANTSAGNGLANMKKRAEELGGALIVNSAANDGTAIEFICPLK